MKYKWSGMVAGAGGLLLLLGAAPGCVATLRVRPAAVVVVDEAPPEPQYEAAPAPRAGYVWVRGRWTYQSGRWVWTQGYWQRERVGYVWVHGHWERRGGRHHWVAGRWVHGNDGARVSRPAPPPQRARPVPPPHRAQPAPPPHHQPASRAEATVSGGVWVEVAPPPPKRAQPPAPRRGFVWVEGRWAWDGGQWQWHEGRWERERSGHVWVPGRWERQGNRHRWVEGHWARR
jgi:hypothetical protein